jgi:hypothetical protein
LTPLSLPLSLYIPLNTSLLRSKKRSKGKEAGKSFVSRTTLSIGNKHKEDIVVLRCVIMNPMTNINILKKILDEQEEIYRCHIKTYPSLKISGSLVERKPIAVSDIMDISIYTDPRGL